MKISEELKKVVRELADAGNAAADKAQESGLSGDDLMEAGICAAADYLENYLKSIATPRVGEEFAGRLAHQLAIRLNMRSWEDVIERVVREEIGGGR